MIQRGSEAQPANLTNYQEPDVNPDGTIQRWHDMRVYGGGIFYVCWCHAEEMDIENTEAEVQNGCGDVSGYPVRAIILQVSGPPIGETPRLYKVQPKQPFEVTVNGRGFRSTDRIAIVKASDCESQASETRWI